MSQKILIIGKNSQVAQSLYKYFHGNLHTLELRNNKKFIKNLNKKIDKYKIKYIINCIAYNDVANAQKKFSLALKLNSNLPALLSEICFKKNIRLVHFSTDYVFDGKNKIGYFPNDKCNPKTHYGLSKYEGELKIKNSGCKYIIIRLCGIYGEYRKNFLKTIVTKLQKKEIIKLPNNIICNPTFVNDIPKLLASIVEVEENYAQNKIIHFGGKNILSWFEFGKKIIKIMKNKSMIIGGTKIISKKNSEDLISRPLNSTILDCNLYNKYKTDMNDAILQTLKKII